MKFTRLLFLMLSVSMLTFFTSCGDEDEMREVICDNAIDDDGDGLTDCDDPDCDDEIVCSISDRRVKENIEPLAYGLETLMQMDTYSFKYITSEGTHLGLMAQDLQKLIPEIVVDDPSSDEDIMAIRYSELIPVLIRAVQEQQLIIEELQAANSALAGTE